MSRNRIQLSLGKEVNERNSKEGYLGRFVKEALTHGGWVLGVRGHSREKQQCENRYRQQEILAYNVFQVATGNP